MANAEALEFLHWLRDDGNHIRCLEQAEQWKQWSSSEGFDPDSILEGLRNLGETTDQCTTFLSFLQGKDQDHIAFSKWIEGLLLRSETESGADLSALSGGKQTRLDNFKIDLKHYKQHLSSELAETQQVARENTTELAETQQFVRENTTEQYDARNGDVTYTYTGRNSSGQLTVYKDYYGWGANGDYIGKDGYYNSLSGQANSRKQIQWVQIGNKDYYRSEIGEKDASLLANAEKLQAQAKHRESAIKQAWETDLNKWTRNEILDSKKLKSFKTNHDGQYVTAKAMLGKLNNVDFKALSQRKKEEIFLIDKSVANKISTNKVILEAKEAKFSEELISRKEHTEGILGNIEALQNEYTDYKTDYTKAKQPTEDYFALFGRLRGNKTNPNSLHRVHIVNYNNEIQRSKGHWKNGNHIYAENYLKRRTELAAKREELFAKSEAGAVKAASATYQEAKRQGNPKKVCLALATDTYIRTLIKEDRNFLANKRTLLVTKRNEWSALDAHEKYMYEEPLLERTGHGFYKGVAHVAGDVMLSVGADILERQIDVAQKAFEDQRRRFSVLRLEFLVTRLTMEFTMAERYENWYARHPLQSYHPVGKWFAHAWRDIWDTLTLPYRAVAAEIKAWNSGEGFWAGMKAGWKEEGKVFHQDVHGINHMVKGFEKLVAPIFDWIPGVKKFVKIDNLVFRALESIPFHIARNGASLGKQLYKVVTLQASWKGIYDGLGRDTRGVRHLIRHIDWLAHDVFTGNFKNIGDVISRDFNTAKKGAKIYLDRKEIREALLIKRHELVARRKLHSHFPHLVKSPMRVITDDVVHNLRNDKAFAGLREYVESSTDGKIAIKASSLYGTSFYKDAEHSAKETVLNEVEVRIANLKDGISLVHGELAQQRKTLKTEWKGMSTKQKAKKKKELLYDYDHNILLKTIIDYELQTTDGAKAFTRLKEDEARVFQISGLFGSEFASLKKFAAKKYSSARTTVKDAYKDFSTPGSMMQKRVQKWILNGALLDWAQGVDKRFYLSVKHGIAFLESPQGRLVKAKALKAYLLFKEINTFKHHLDPYQKGVKQLDTDLKDYVAAYEKARLCAKLYREERSYLLRQWKKWGVRDGKIALTAYDISLRPQFTIDNSTSPPTVTCSPLSVKDSKSVNANITGKHDGERFFMRLMWTQLLTDSFTGGASSNHSSQQRLNKLVKRIEMERWVIDYRIHRMAYRIKQAKVFFSNHIVLKDIVRYEDGGKIKAARQLAAVKLDTLSQTIERLHSRISLLSPIAARARVSKAVRRETDFIRLMNIQVSEFNKNNYKLFEQHKFYDVKLIALQAALAYDFDDTIKTKDGYTSRYKEMKSNAASNNKTLTADYNADKLEEKEGANLTIGQALVSLEVAPTRIQTLTLKEQWNLIYKSKSSTDSGSASSQVKIPPSPPTPTSTTTANLLLLYRNYHLIKRLTKKNVRKAAEDNAADFDEITSKDVDIAERRLNREAIRLDDDIDLFKDEIVLDEDIAKEAINADAKLIGSDLESEADLEVLLPGGRDLEPGGGIDEFANSVIETATSDVANAVVNEVTDTVTDTVTEAESDEAAAETLLDGVVGM